GAPKQEKWIYKYRDRLTCIKTFLAIGATINFEAGYTRRSPKWMSESGLEWLYRLMSEPGRLWKRYLVEDTTFAWLVAQKLLNRYQYRLPIGQVLQEAGLLSAEQVALVLSAQNQYRQRRFGELVVEQGWLSPTTLDFFIDDFPMLSNISRAEPLGHYLKSAALLDEQQIHAILAEQALYGGRFGEIATTKGWVPKPTIELLLSNLPKRTPNPEKLSGNQYRPAG
ncbi:MAG: WecB/TagA/CpsF family glycosyltransferase, partial [Cyanobacteria bacterium P01_A01_bin.37]